MTVERNDWDPESNQEELRIENTEFYGTGGRGYSFASVDASGSIWIDNPETTRFNNNTVMNSDISQSAFGEEEVSISNGRIRITEQETIINQPTTVWPVYVDTHESSWSYVFLYMLSWIATPWLIIWSKIKGRPAGFRVRQR